MTCFGIPIPNSWDSREHAFQDGIRVKVLDGNDFSSKDTDLPEVLECWNKRNPKKDTDRTAKYFMVPVSEIVEKKYDLSINRYKESKHEEVSYEPPKADYRQTK
jgi:hypothetical protein